MGSQLIFRFVETGFDIVPETQDRIVEPKRLEVIPTIDVFREAALRLFGREHLEQMDLFYWVDWAPTGE